MFDRVVNKTKYSRMNQIKFAEYNLEVEVIEQIDHITSIFFKGCISQIWLGPFLNALFKYTTTILHWNALK